MTPTASAREASKRAEPAREGHLVRMIIGYYHTQLVYVATKLGLADAMGSGPRAVRDLAEAAGAHPATMLRFLRALASAGLVAEAPDGQFGLTPQGAPLSADAPGSLRELALWTGEVNYPAFGALCDAVQTGESTFTGVFGQPLFAFLAEHNEAGARFDGFMSRLRGASAAALLDAYDFSSIDSVVDVGGGCGSLLASLLRAHPNVRGVLQDLPTVTQRAQKYFLEQRVADRVSVVAQDFFVNVHAGADVYLLSQTLHDWRDDQCVRLLENCRRGMAHRSRLLVIEQLDLDPRDGRNPVAESDMFMLVLTGGQERSVEAYRQLFQSAGLELLQVSRLHGSWALLEARCG